MTECAQCQYETTSDLELQIHNASAHLFYYQCKFCQQSFTSRYLVARHLLLEHNAFREEDLKGTWLELKKTKDGKENANQITNYNIICLGNDNESKNPDMKNCSECYSVPINDQSKTTEKEGVASILDSFGQINGSLVCDQDDGQYAWLRDPKLNVQSEVKLTRLSSEIVTQSLSGSSARDNRFELPKKSQKDITIEHDIVIKEEPIAKDLLSFENRQSNQNFVSQESLGYLDDNHDNFTGPLPSKRARYSFDRELETSNLETFHSQGSPIFPVNHEEIDNHGVDNVTLEMKDGSLGALQVHSTSDIKLDSKIKANGQPKKTIISNCPFCLDNEHNVPITNFYGHVKERHSTIFKLTVGNTLANHLERLGYVERRGELKSLEHLPCPLCHQEMTVPYLRVHLATEHNNKKGGNYWALIRGCIKYWQTSYIAKYRELKDVNLYDLKMFALCAPFCPNCKKTFDSWEGAFKHKIRKNYSCKRTYSLSYDLKCEFCPKLFAFENPLKDHVQKYHKQYYKSFRTKFTAAKEVELNRKLCHFPKRCIKELNLIPQCHICEKFYEDWVKVDRHLLMKHKGDIQNILNAGLLDKSLLSEKQIEVQEEMLKNGVTVKQMNRKREKPYPANPENTQLKSAEYQCLICFEHHVEENLLHHIRTDHENGSCLADYLEKIMYIKKRDVIFRTGKVFCPFCSGSMTLDAFQTHAKNCRPIGIDWPILIALLKKLSLIMQEKVLKKVHKVESVIVPSLYITFVLGLPKCLYCTRNFPSWQSALVHLAQMNCNDHSNFKIELSNYLTCIECGKQAGSRPTLINHLKDTHKKTHNLIWQESEPKKECPICFERFIAHVNLLRHLQTKHFPNERLIVEKNELITDDDCYLGRTGTIQTWFEACEWQHADSLEEEEISRWCVLCMNIFKGNDLYTHFETDHVGENGPVFANNLKRAVYDSSPRARPMTPWIPCPFCFVPFHPSNFNHFFKHIKQVHSKSDDMARAIRGANELWFKNLGHAKNRRGGFYKYEVWILILCSPQCYLCQNYFKDWDSVCEHISDGNCHIVQKYP